MAQILKPANLSLTWASGGDILNPGDAKYATGWQVEIPPRQWFNYLDNRQDTAIAHINQHGVAVWDASTEYQANKSYVQGPTNGIIYRCVQTHTNQNPETDITNAHWVVAFASAGNTYTKAEVDAKTTVASTAQAQGLSSNTTLLTPLRLADAFKGANQSLSGNGYQKLPGGLIIQWGRLAVGDTPVVDYFGSVAFPIAFPSQIFQVNAALYSYAGENFDSTFAVTAHSLTGFDFTVQEYASEIQNVDVVYIALGM